MNWLLNRQLMELRFRGYSAWDRSGALCDECQNVFPGLYVHEGSPAQVVLRHDEHQVQLTFGVEGASVQAAAIRDSDSFLDYAETFFGAAFRVLEIRTLTRVGHRTFHHEAHPTKDEVNKRIASLGKRANAGAAFFAESEDPRLSAKHLRKFALSFEDEKIGIRVSVEGANTKISVTGPHAQTIRDHLPKPDEVIVADIDIYTLKPITVTDLLVTELTKSNLKMIKTRILPLLKG